MALFQLSPENYLNQSLATTTQLGEPKAPRILESYSVTEEVLNVDFQISPWIDYFLSTEGLYFTNILKTRRYGPIDVEDFDSESRFVNACLRYPNIGCI